MKLDRRSLRSKVARRIFFLFIACALLPIAALAYISFAQVTNYLHEQSQQRLRQASKAAALGIYERLLFLEAEMKTMASVLAAGARPQPPKLEDELGGDLRQRFNGLFVITPSGTLRPVLGHTGHPPQFTGDETAHVRAGKTLVSVQYPADLSPRIFMAMALKPEKASPSILLAEINPAYLWRASERDSLPPLTELSVLDESSQLLVSSAPMPPSFPQRLAVLVGQSTSGQFEWQHDGETYLASYWTLPLRFRFHVPKWTVVLSESKAHMLAALTQYKKTFPLVILISLGVVILLSTNQIRRRLVPLEQLQEGTRLIARREFDRPVTIKSGDEFEELAASFNAMARQLQKQFSTLATMAEIDRAVLSALDTEKILETVLSRISGIFPCDRASFILFQADGSPNVRLYLRNGNPEGATQAEPVTLNAEELETQWGGPQGAFLVENDPSHPLAPFFTHGIKAILAIPVFLAQRLSGIIALGYASTPALSEEDLLQARQLADQIAVAIHNSQLFEQTKKQAVELERVNRVKDEFLGIMSHELRTPITVILGYTGMVREKTLGEVNEEQDKALEAVTRHSMDLLDQVTSIMQATVIEVGATKIEPQQLNLLQLLDDLRSLYSIPLKKDLTIIWDYGRDLPTVRLDGTKLKYILRNLIGNAIKFTEKGSVTITARYLSSSRTAEFKVTDTGIGIPKEELTIIFEKFRQVDSSIRRTYGGVGLGLFIVRKFASMMGGSVEVESELGVGSTFTLTLPCEV